MNADAHKPPMAAPVPIAHNLLARSATGFRAFVDMARPLKEALVTVETLGNGVTAKAATRALFRLDQFEPSITMIGQIKSGKTTLVNSLVGWPNLLPSDVNPWTSVVTSLHLSPRAQTPPTKALFRFFDDAEWDRLTAGGGRIGELAARAGADDELLKIKEQVALMREKSKMRLGRKFEMLLGSEHNYGYFDPELVERYVCLGDDFDDDTVTSKSQGRFADITRSADLTMQQSGYPMALCIRDTPGVNDTFMIREQITIKSIRDSRICVVVLSAHQALSSTDLGLIRLISQVKSREILIFINRIDELADPSTQVPQIRQSIQDTLATHKGPADADIIFGSALWAEHAMTGNLNTLPKNSQKALLSWAEDQSAPTAQASDTNAFMWDMSGLPQLSAALASRIAEGEGAELLGTLAAETSNLLNSIKLSDNLDAKTQVGQAQLKISDTQMSTDLAQIKAQAKADLVRMLDKLEVDFQARLTRAHQSFLTRATDALAKHLEVYGENTAWTYDPGGLRIMLNSAYKIFGTKCQAAFSQTAEEAGQAYCALYQRAFDLPADLFAPRISPPPRIAPPVSLGQTIALDLQGSWWKGWWNRRHSYDAQAARYYDLIKSETDGLLTGLTGDQAQAIRDSMIAALDDFLNAQSDSFAAVTTGRGDGLQIDQFFGLSELEDRDRRITAALESLERYADAS